MWKELLAPSTRVQIWKIYMKVYEINSDSSEDTAAYGNNFWYLPSPHIPLYSEQMYQILEFLQRPPQTSLR